MEEEASLYICIILVWEYIKGYGLKHVLFGKERGSFLSEYNIRKIKESGGHLLLLLDTIYI